jgi:protein TonB
VEKPKIEQPKVTPQEEPKFTAPVETPAEVPTDTADTGAPAGVPGGEPGGVEGGVTGGQEGGVVGGAIGGVPGGELGGVVGGVEGGVPAAEPTPEPEIPKGPVRIGGQIKAPKKTRNVDPTYPSLALEAHVQGVVILEATISASGEVTDVKVLRGHPLLEKAAVAAVQQWAYSPTMLNGTPVPVVMTVTVNFKLPS